MLDNRQLLYAFHKIINSQRKQLLQLSLNIVKHRLQFCTRETGLLPLAAANNIVLLFPQIRANFWNWKGCWNAWGYLKEDRGGFQYATKQGKQMKVLAKMVEKAAKISMFT